MDGGRELGQSHLARRIHELGGRADRPFVTIDTGVWTHSEVELLVFGRDRSASLSRSGLLEDALRKSAGNIAAVQALLSIKRKTLYEKLARHRLIPGQFR